MKIGVLGGTFNPPHFAHMRLAEEAADSFGLERVYLVLSANPPHKERERILPVKVRWQMLQAACESNPRLFPCDLEMKREGLSYTIETLEQISAEIGKDAAIHLIIGADCGCELETWKSYREIISRYKVIVACRPGFDFDSLPALVREKVLLLNMPLMEISSSMIRDHIEKGRSIRYLVPEAVREFLVELDPYCIGNRI